MAAADGPGRERCVDVAVDPKELRYWARMLSSRAPVSLYAVSKAGQTGQISGEWEVVEIDVEPLCFQSKFARVMLRKKGA